MMIAKRLFRGVGLFVSLLTLLGLIACGQETVVDELSQEQAIKVVSGLAHAGISATHSRASGRGASYVVRVRSRDLSRALQVVDLLGMSSLGEDPIEQLTRQRGFIPNSPEVQAKRLDRALAIEIERLVEALPAVIDAQVSGSSGSANASQTEPSATVVVRLLEDRVPREYSAVEVQRLVQNVVPGLREDRIQVQAVELDLGLSAGAGTSLGLERVFLLNFEVPRAQLRNAQERIVLMGVILLVSGGILGFALGSLRRGQKGPVPSRADFFIEGKTGEGSPALLGNGPPQDPKRKSSS